MSIGRRYREIIILTLLLCLLSSPSVWGDEIAIDIGQTKTALDLKAEIVSTVSECINDRGAIDIENLISNIRMLSGDIDSNSRGELLSYLGQMLLYEDDIRLTKTPMTGRDPIWILRKNYYRCLFAPKRQKSADIPGGVFANLH